MDKVTAFLERHVQWLVLCLALAYVAYTAYDYLYLPPLTATLGTGRDAVKVLPAAVDPTIVKNYVEPIERDLAVKDVSKPEVADVWHSFQGLIAGDKIQVASWTLPTVGGHGGVGMSTEARPEDVGAPPPIDHLPKIPPAAPVAGATTVRRTVIVVGGVRQDLPYYSGLFAIDMAKLAAAGNEAFDKQGVPPGLFRIEFAQVELLREEFGANGAWGKPTVVKSLPIVDIPPYPGDNAKQEDFFKYREWIDANQDVLVRPAFYQTAPDAEGWVAPGNVPLAPVPIAGQPVIAERPFDPSRDVPRTNEQRQMVQEYRQQEIQRRKAAAQQRRGGGTALPPSGTYPPAGFNPFPTAPVAPPRMAPQPAALPPANPNPAGQPGINPNLGMQDSQILVHDTTIQEGRTYRYAVRYKLYNPLYGNAANFATKDVTRQFAIISPDPTDPAAEKANPGIWSDKTSLEPSTHVFVTNISLWNNQATFEIFIWENGRWHEASSPKLVPGDPVNSGKSITPLTVVDVRKDARSNQIYVILVDGFGTLQRRDVDSDKVNEEFQKLKALAGAAAAAQ